MTVKERGVKVFGLEWVAGFASEWGLGRGGGFAFVGDGGVRRGEVMAFEKVSECVRVVVGDLGKTWLRRPVSVFVCAQAGCLRHLRRLVWKGCGSRAFFNGVRGGGRRVGGRVGR